MLGSRFIKFIKPTQSRHLPKLNLFLNYLDYKTKDATMRAMHLTPNGYGSRLLVEIIKLADMPTLMRLKDNDRELANYVLSIVRDVEKPIDIRSGKHTTKSLFIKAKTPCYELMTPSRRISPLLEIPYDKDYNNPLWKDIKPLRVVDMGACDLKFSIHTDYFQFTQRSPVYVIYALDCFSLIMKFVAYCKSKTSIPDPEQLLLDFVHNEIIVPSLLADTTALWLRNVYKQQLISFSPLESFTSTIWDTVNTDSLGADFTAAMIDVRFIKNNLLKQSIEPQVALGSLLLTTDKQSFSKYFTDLYTTTRTPDEQPYVWVDCLKYLSWWEFIIMITSYLPSHPDAVSFEKDVLRDVRICLMMKPWSSITQSLPYRTMIRNRLEGLYTYLKQTT